jgi:hypothetical protein
MIAYRLSTSEHCDLRLELEVERIVKLSTLPRYVPQEARRGVEPTIGEGETYV